MRNDSHICSGLFRWLASAAIAAALVLSAALPAIHAAQHAARAASASAPHSGDHRDRHHPAAPGDDSCETCRHLFLARVAPPQPRPALIPVLAAPVARVLPALAAEPCPPAHRAHPARGPPRA